MASNSLFFRKSAFALVVFTLLIGMSLPVFAQTQTGSTEGSFQVNGPDGCVSTSGDCDAPVECPLGYIPSGDDCCLDSNDNGICDSDETPTNPGNDDTGGGGGGGGGGGSGGGSSGGGSSGGGSSSGSSCTPSWDCTEWSGCVDGFETRECLDSNFCNTLLDRPAIARTCEPANSALEEENNGVLSLISGAVVGVGGKPTTFGWLLVILIVIAAYFLVKKYFAGGEKPKETSTEKPADTKPADTTPEHDGAPAEEKAPPKKKGKK